MLIGAEERLERREKLLIKRATFSGQADHVRIGPSTMICETPRESFDFLGRSSEAMLADPLAAIGPRKDTVWQHRIGNNNI